MKKESFFVTRGIPGIAAKSEVIKMDDNGIVVGRWLPISKYPRLMNSRDCLRVLTRSWGRWSGCARGSRTAGREGAPAPTLSDSSRRR